MEFTAISLFSWAGWMDVWFWDAGFKILWANDINLNACKTYEANHTNPIRHGDLNDFISELDWYKWVDVVFWWPPCQWFSVAGKMNPDDPRSKLIFSFLDVVQKVQPKAFVIENVKALGALGKWQPIREKIHSKAKELWYEINHMILNSVDYGVPQKRERVFFIGIKKSIPQAIKLVSWIEDSIKLYQSEAPKIGQIISALGVAGSPENPVTCKAKITIAENPILRKSPYAWMLFNWAGRPIDPNGYSNTLPASMGGNRTPIVDENHIFGTWFSWVENYHNQLINWWNSLGFWPAPSFLRRLTIEEARRIQTFPENYVFIGNNNSIYTQIWNAVPCWLSNSVARMLKDFLTTMH